MEIYPPGIPDSEFIRGDVPMTKAEVRAVTMSKARLRDGMRVLDIGAGTGSFTIEAALLCPAGEVVAVECDPEAIELLQRNIEKFGVKNVRIVEGTAPDALANLGLFDRAFLGGSKGHMHEILQAVTANMRPDGWLVSNTICVETTNEILIHLRKAPWTHWEIAQVCVARGVPIGAKLTRFEPLSPVWIAAARLGE